MKEKRQHPRVEKKVKSEVHSTDGMTYSTTLDLSQGGIFIRTPESVKIGSEVMLSIKIPEGESIEIKGVVRWMNDDKKDENKSGMGIEFVGLNEKETTKIKKILGS